MSCVIEHEYRLHSHHTIHPYVINVTMVVIIVPFYTVCIIHKVNKCLNKAKLMRYFYHAYHTKETLRQRDVKSTAQTSQLSPYSNDTDKIVKLKKFV